jgi:hypothetical protein
MGGRFTTRRDAIKGAIVLAAGVTMTPVAAAPEDGDRELNIEAKKVVS